MTNEERIIELLERNNKQNEIIIELLKVMEDHQGRSLNNLRDIEYSTNQIKFRLDMFDQFGIKRKI